MTDAGFFKGTSAEQDARFADKKKKLLKSMKFGDNLSQKVDMTRINLDCIRPWVVKRVTELLNFEDEVVCNYVLNQLEERHPDPKEIQINITGFLNSKNARIFLTELWDLLLSAMDNPDGIPGVLIEAKKTEITKRQEEEQRIQVELRRKEDELRTRGTLANSRASAASTGPVSQPIVPNRGTASNATEVGNGVSAAQATDQTAETVAKMTSSRRSRSPSSPRPRRRSSPKKEEESSRRSRHETSRRRHRRRHSHSSSSSDSSSVDERQRTKGVEPRESRRHYRSRSRESTERASRKRPVPDSDWRKDLMAGRRRSPPEMPENSYYGYEKKHRSEGKRSRDRHHDDHRRPPDPAPRRASPAPQESIGDRRRHGYKHREDDREESADRKQRRRYHGSRSPPSRKDHLAAEDQSSTTADRVNKYHNRRAQWAQEDDEAVLEASELQKSSRHKDRPAVMEAHATHKRPRSPTPEGPGLPPSMVPASEKAPTRQEVSSASSESGSEDSSSSSEESASSSSEGSSDESEDGAAMPSVHSRKKTPEGPALPPPPLVVPEGPALPPAANDVAGRTDRTVVKRETLSGGSVSSSSEGSGGSSSSSSSESESGSESSSNTSEDVQEPKRRKVSSSDHVVPPKNHHTAKRVHSPEKPMRNPSRADPRKADAVDFSDRRYRREERKRKHEEAPEASAEEALRRRALASLMRASGDRRRGRSPSS